MLYCDKNFKTKKALKEAVAARLADPTSNPPVTVYNPETFSGEVKTPDNGKGCVGGPHYPEPHKWYASIVIENGEVVKVS